MRSRIRASIYGRTIRDIWDVVILRWIGKRTNTIHEMEFEEEVVVAKYKIHFDEHKKQKSQNQFRPKLGIRFYLNSFKDATQKSQTFFKNTFQSRLHVNTYSR